MGMLPSASATEIASRRAAEAARVYIVCNDFESFDKQMVEVANNTKDIGLVSEIRAFMDERTRSLKRQEDEAERKRSEEKFSHMMQDLEEFRQESIAEIKQFREDIHKRSEMLQQTTDRVQNLAHDVRQFGVSCALSRRRVRSAATRGRSGH
ncbi:hypothetical protein DENSPDRAFT_164378 [Dentipellis sp. KUC8613]|nr:hypothetical protein DENSPDRAFT_164378 [Dentipellis sp. KUC8613]